MESLVITTWLWGHKYDLSDVRKLYGGFRRHLKQPFRFICFSEIQYQVQGIEFYPIPDLSLTGNKGCFARLRMFDPAFQIKHRMEGRIVCCDLDTVIVNNMDPVVDRPEPFVILQGANSVNPCPFCGALIMLRAGAYPDVWSDFSIEAAARVPFHEFPDDQGWIWYKIPDAAGWKTGQGGVYAFCKPGWPKGFNLPADARIVAFNGWRSPKKFSELRWIKRNWVE